MGTKKTIRGRVQDRASWENRQDSFGRTQGREEEKTGNSRNKVSKALKGR